MAPPEADRRKKNPRVLRRLPVRFGSDAKMCGGTVADISEGGMKIECPEPFPVHSLITVFVQFPRHSIRLRARVVWCGAGGGGTLMGLALTQPEPTLKRAYGEWQAEVKQALAETPQDPAQGAPAQPAAAAAVPGPAAVAAAPPGPPPPTAPEPNGPITRRLESRQGQSYEARLERQPDGWSLTIVQLPRQLGGRGPR